MRLLRHTHTHTHTQQGLYQDGHILYVEDNPSDVRLLLMAFDHFRFKPQSTVVTDGEEALILLQAISERKTAPPNVILLDLHLPKKNGNEILAIIKNDPNLQGLPTIIFSTTKNPNEIQECKELGAIFASKPVLLHEYKEIVDLLKGFCATKP